MASKREQGIQLRAYAQWNPDNDPEKIADLEKLQNGIDNGTLISIGRAVVKIDSPLDKKYYSSVLKGKNIGRALLESVHHGSIPSEATIGDGTVVHSAATIKGNSTVYNSTLYSGSYIDNALVLESTLRAHTTVMSSQVSGSTLKNCKVREGSFVLDCDLYDTPVIGATLENVEGSTNGQEIKGGPLENSVLVSLGDTVHIIPKRIDS